MMNIEKIIGNRNVGDILHMEHGVYFLFCGKELIYIGKSRRCHERVLTHTKEGRIPFDRFVVLPIEERWLDGVEAFLISEMKPSFNIKHVTQSENDSIIAKFHAQKQERVAEYWQRAVTIMINEGIIGCNIPCEKLVMAEDSFLRAQNEVIVRVGDGIYSFLGFYSVAIFCYHEDTGEVTEIRLSNNDARTGSISIGVTADIRFIAKRMHDTTRLLDSLLIGRDSSGVIFDFELDELFSPVPEAEKVEDIGLRPGTKKLIDGFWYFQTEEGCFRVPADKLS
jgi:hypothetical protein